MPKRNSEIFISPYRIQVINAYKAACRPIIDHATPTPINNAIELGCGTGFLYEHLASEVIKTVLVGYDRDRSSLQLFQQAFPEAQTRLGQAHNLPVADTSVDMVLGFSAYPMLTQDGVVNEISRVLRPGGRLVAFQDSFISGPWEDQTTYEKMQRLEHHHRLMMQLFSRNDWNLLGGEDPAEAAVVTPYASIESQLAPDMHALMPSDKIIIASWNDTGAFRLKLALPEEANEKFQSMKMELGNPRILENLAPHFGQEAIEYIRLRYVVAEKKLNS